MGEEVRDREIPREFEPIDDEFGFGDDFGLGEIVGN